MENNSDNYIEMPMKWHKFLIYFSLWMGALGCLVTAFQLMTGAHYGSGMADMVYSYFKALKTVDVIFGLLYIAIGIFMIYTHFQLSNLKIGAPRKLTLVYILQLAGSIGYILLAASIINVSLAEVVDSQMIASLLTSVVMIFVNRVYYGKRSHMFVC